MRRIVLSAVAASALAASPALALNARTFVSAVGDDANPCSRTQPCLTFQHAHDVTESGGVIEPITPGGYGAVIISKAIKIVNHGVGTVGIFPPPGGSAVTISAGSTDHVVLEGLTIDGLGVGGNGILVNSAGQLAILNCNISDTTPNTGNGIAIAVSSGSLNFVIEGSYIAGHTYGIVVSGTAPVSGVVKTTTLQGNSDGFVTNGTNTGTVTLDNVVAAGNYNGIYPHSTTTQIYFTRSLFSNSGNVAIASGSLAPISFADNRFSGNQDIGSFGTSTLH